MEVDQAQVPVEVQGRQMVSTGHWIPSAVGLDLVREQRGLQIGAGADLWDHLQEREDQVVQVVVHDTFGKY